jgi:hypothetical protein
MPPVGFEPTIPASAGPQIYALDKIFMVYFYYKVNLFYKIH